MKSEMKMPRDRDREVKFLENSREILEKFLRIEKSRKKINFWSKCFFISQTFTLEYDKRLFLNQYVTGNFGDGPWLRHVSLTKKWGH